VKAQFILRDNTQAHPTMVSAWRTVKELFAAGLAARLTIQELKPNRTLDQNALMWSVLGDIARQVDWHCDGRMSKLEPEDWKDILTAGLRKHQRVAQGIEGGFVMLGQRTSKMTIAEMSELIELAHAFGAEHGVKWAPTSIGSEQAA
jgi:hypothetical protein